jgi:hypothetical protein
VYKMVISITMSNSALETITRIIQRLNLDMFPSGDMNNLQFKD